MNSRHSPTSEDTTLALLRAVKRGLYTVLATVANWRRKISLRRRETRMQLCETLSLGDKRFLALVMVEQQKFLVGGAPNSISLLAKLPAQASSAQFNDEVHLL